jgi:hypothetical protein
VQNPGVDVASVPERHPFRLAGLVAGGVVLVLAAAAAVLFLWLRTYGPLAADRGPFAPGPGLAADVEPVTGSGGKPVFIPAYRRGTPFDTALTLRNKGRFAVTLTGLASSLGAEPLQPVGLLATDSSTASADPSHLHPFASLRLDPGDTAIVVVRWRLDCAHSKTESSADRVPLSYDYLSVFTGTERVRLPFAVTLRCSDAGQGAP